MIIPTDVKLSFNCSLAQQKVEDNLSNGCYNSQYQQGLEELANRVFTQMFGFEGFPPFPQGQKAFHAVTRAHVRAGVVFTLQ